MKSRDRLSRYRWLFGCAFLLSLPLLGAMHAPMLPSEALSHRLSHTAESALGPGCSLLVGADFLTPAISLVGFVIITAIGRRK